MEAYVLKIAALNQIFTALKVCSNKHWSNAFNERFEATKIVIKNFENSTISKNAVFLGGFEGRNVGHKNIMKQLLNWEQSLKEVCLFIKLGLNLQLIVIELSRYVVSK